MVSLGHVVEAQSASIGNHLWQSTLFGLIAAMVAVALRRNEARLRFWVWFLASAKFLVPIAPLVELGSYLHGYAAARPSKQLTSVVEIIGQPFAGSAQHVAGNPTLGYPFLTELPLCLATLWSLGTVAVLIVWWHRWFKIVRIKRAATPLTSGLETDVLKTVSALIGGSTLSILLSNSHLEPGIFGIARPVLLWPTAMTQELTPMQLRAVLAHETWHVRRKDNLTAAVQMLIEAVFWFHPFVWWFGSRQMEERERACDEGVLSLGSPPTVYAESILKTCKFCIEAPLPCVAGVNGSNLKKRITRIMQTQNIRTLSRTKKCFLGAITTAAVVAPLIFGAFSAPQLGAQTNATAATSGPLRITAIRRNVSGSNMTQFKHTGDDTAISNTTVRNLIQIAYSLKDYQLTGGPEWIDRERFDVSYTGGGPTSPQSLFSNTALKEILSQQFHLVLHQETKPGPVFALVVASGGAKFANVTPANAPGTDEPLLGMRVMEKGGQGQVSITGGPGGLADVLSSQVGRPIIDKTGLTGTYSIDFHWATTSATADSIAADLQQQLGLSLTPQEGPVETSIVDSLSMPAGS